jgi:ketosteroid isomerase-like protein
MALDGADRARLIPISHVAYAGHQVRADNPRRLRLEYVDVCGYEGRGDRVEQDSYVQRKQSRLQSTRLPHCGTSRMRNYPQAPSILLILALVYAFGAPSAHAGDSAVDTNARRAHEAYTSAINSNNLELLVAMFTDDVVFLSPNEPAVIGKAAVRAWSAEYLKAYKIHWDKAVKEFAVAGEWAFERYSYQQNDKPRGGGASVTDTGKGLIVYHHDSDGKWRVARDAWNSDLPLPAK